MLTELQKRKLTRLFNWHDSNGNGYLEVEDYQQMVKNLGEIMGWGPGMPEYDELYMRFMFAWSGLLTFGDRSGDNRVSLDEWLEYMDTILGSPEGAERTINSTATIIADMLDVNRDGKISPEEYRLFYRAYNIEEDLVSDVFPRLDTNGDGFLSRNEVYALVGDFYRSDDPKSPGNWIVGAY